jgi:signal transduction histidine kinase
MISLKHHNLHKNHALFAASITGLAAASFWLLLSSHALLWAAVFAIVSAYTVYHIIQQGTEIQALREQLVAYQEDEQEYVTRAQNLRIALHDLRNPMSALKLSIQILQRVSCEEDQRHLNRMEESLEAALEQVTRISNIHKNRKTKTFAMLVVPDESLVEDYEARPSKV